MEGSDRGRTWQGGGACVVGGSVAGEHAWWGCALQGSHMWQGGHV